MKKTVTFLTSLFVILLLVTACSQDNTGKPTNPSNKKNHNTLTISAAVSLKDAMDIIQSQYQDLHPEVTLNFNFGGSGSLQQQISQGAPVDLFFSAAEDKFDILVEEDSINEGDRINLLGNELVLVAPKGQKTIRDLDDLSNHEVNKIAIGTPETVPAGKYAKESFENMNIWGDIKEKIVYAKDVRQVLSYVETGNIDAGVVYKSDALMSNQVDIIATIDADTHTEIVYPVGVLKDSKQYESAKDFYTYLQSDEALKVFEEYGFTTQ